MKRLILCGLLLALSIHVVAQDETCPVVVEQALTALADNCADLGRNTACYGYDVVGATFVDEVPPETFNQPSDREMLRLFDSIQTSPYDAERQEWGIALLNTQANVPDTVPGQAVRFLLLGDAQLENHADPASYPTETDPVPARIQFETAARTQPTTNANTVSVLAPGATLDVDATSADRYWLRGFVDGRLAWISRDFVVPNVDLEDLPVFTSSTRTPMQSFYFTTGFGESNCVQATDVVTVQSPDNLTVDLTVNGVDIRIGSTISFQNLSEDRIVMMVHEGSLLTVDGQSVLGNQALIGILGPDDNIIGWEGIRPMNEREMQIGETVMAAMDSLIPDEIASTTTLTHRVQAGDTLFSIARNYDASIPAIIAANGITDVNTIPVGEELLIPDAGSGFVTIPTANIAPPITAEDVAADDAVVCSGFRPTSPLGGLAFGSNEFFWNPPQTAVDYYRVTVTNSESGQTLSGEVRAPQTSLTLDLGVQNIGGGFDFYWHVQAFVDNAPVCMMGNVVVQRAAAQAIAPVVPVFDANWGCSGPGYIFVNWNNAAPGDTITITFIEIAVGLPVTFTENGATGFATYGPYGDLGSAVVTTASGQSTTLTPATIDAAAC